MAIRTPLSRDRVVREALDLADGSGLEAVTMRRLGDELGFEAMSLYRHVSNMDDLLAGMLDLVLAEWELPAGGEPVDAIRTSARSVHDALLRHPWSARLLMTGRHMRPGRLAYMEFLLGRLHESGLGADETYHVYHLLDGYIFGFSLWEIAYSSVGDDEATRERIAKTMQSIPWDDHPHLAAHRDQHMAEGPHREASAFGVGLGLILAGLQKS